MKSDSDRVIVLVVALSISLLLYSGPNASSPQSGSVSIRFVDSLMAGVPNRLDIRAVSFEDVDSAIMLLHQSIGNSRPPLTGELIWTGKVTEFDTIRTSFPIPGLKPGDYKYGVSLTYPNRTSGQLQIGGELNVRVRQEGSLWVEGDKWALELLDIEVELEKRGLKGLPMDSVFKVYPELKVRFEDLKLSPSSVHQSQTTSHP